MAPLFAGDTELGSAEVRIARSPVIEVVTRQPQPITADGEVVAVTPARFGVLAKAVRVYAPKAPVPVEPAANEEARLSNGDAALAGGCACGSVRYRLRRRPMFVNCCHCSECQRQLGSAFAVNAVIETEAIEVLAGRPSP